MAPQPGQQLNPVILIHEFKLGIKYNVMFLLFLLAGKAAALIEFKSILKLQAAKICLALAIAIIACYIVILIKVLPAGLAPLFIKGTEYISCIFIFLIAFLASGLLVKWHTKPEYALVYGKLILALQIIIIGSFLRVTIGKALHHKEMELFFTSSGLPVWLNYFVMVAEVSGAPGIWLDFKLKTGIAAACCLAILMAGAIFIHAHNGDPFSDSSDAVFLLICLIAYIAIRVRNNKSVQIY